MTDDRPDDVRAGRVVEGTQRFDRVESGRAAVGRERGDVGLGHRNWTLLRCVHTHFEDFRSGRGVARQFHLRSGIPTASCGTVVISRDSNPDSSLTVRTGST